MIGENLKILRKQLKKTQDIIAKDLDMQKQTYQNYELQKRQPDIETLKRLADYFHTTIDYLVGHEVPYQLDKAMFNEEQLAVIDELKKLNKEQCYMLLAYIEGLKAGNNRRENILRTIKGE